MATDYPYRIEPYKTHQANEFAIVTTADGVLCRGENYMELRRIVDILNEAMALGLSPVLDEGR